MALGRLLTQNHAGAAREQTAHLAVIVIFFGLVILPISEFFADGETVTLN
jgi:hypothetical protein